MRTCSKTECNHNVMMSSRNAPRVLPIPPRGELCAIRFRFWTAGTTHLSTGRPHGIRPSPRRPREEDPGRLIHIAVQNVSAAIRTRHTGSPFLERMSPSRQEDLRIRGGRRRRRDPHRSRRRGPPDPRGAPASAAPLPHLLRLFPSAALLHPPLRLFFSYSEGSRGVAGGKGRSRRGRGRTRGRRCARGRRPIRLFRIIGPARLAADANGPAGGAARRLGKATGAHLPASAPRPSSSSHSSTNPDEKGSISRPGTSVSPSHRNRWLRSQDRRDGAGRMGAGRGWRAQGPHTSLRPGLFRAITPILTSPKAFLARKAHCGGPGSTRCRKERAEQDPGAAESAEIAGPRAEKRGLRTEMRVA